MATDDRLIQFVREALSTGRTRDDIRVVLTNAGWSKHEIAEALGSFADIEFTPLVPRPRAHLTARDTFVYLLLFASLAFVASYLVTLVHAILELALPDLGDLEWSERNATDSIRWSIATLAVATPVLVWMTRFTRRQIFEDAGRRRSPVRKWLTYVALFVTALVFFGDAVFVIYSFLNGEATLRFLLKALTVACVSAAIFAFYLRDIEDGVDER
ncbi:MAG: DUF5671 domain-containing protein [Pseudorhodobacter sp.]|nr:DUF5671 domain-containing protein [Pseudorhodobacter sp.]